MAAPGAWRLPATERDARARALLERVGLWERRADPSGDFSRGMKQKLAVARALLHEPQLVFLDEPAAGLDPVAAAELNADLTELAAREGVTVFLTTHDLTQAEKLCQQVAIIRDGKLLAAGAPSELRARAGGERAEIIARGVDDQLLAQLRALPNVATIERQADQLVVTFRGAAEVAPLVGLIVANGGAVEEVRKGVNSLEDAFLEVVKEGV
jgi:ABC-2 type transport system ATP-binding protein